MSNLTPFGKFIRIVHETGSCVGISGNKEHGNYRVYTYEKVSLEGEPVLNQMRAVTPEQHSTPDRAIEAAYTKLVKPTQASYNGWEWDPTIQLWHKGNAYVREEDGLYCFFSLTETEAQKFMWMAPEAISGFESLRLNNPYLMPPTEVK
jgi:hypothetical protein